MKILSLDKSGKQEGPTSIVYEGPIPNEFAGVIIRGEANGGVTLKVEHEDEFGHSIVIYVTLNPEDIQRLQP